MKKYTSIIVPTLVIISFMHFKNSQSAENPFENFRNEINGKYIHISTDQVCQAIKDERPVAEKFEEYLNKDSRVNKIIEIRKQGTTVDSLKATEMVTNVSKDFTKKQDSLLSDLKNTTRMQTVCALLCPIGLVAGLFLIQNHRTQPHGAVTGVVGTLSAVICLICSSKMPPIQTHLDETYKMRAEWQHQFKKEKQPEKPEKVL